VVSSTLQQLIGRLRHCSRYNSMYSIPASCESSRWAQTFSALHARADGTPRPRAISATLLDGIRYFVCCRYVHGINHHRKIHSFASRLAVGDSRSISSCSCQTKGKAAEESRILSRRESIFSFFRRHVFLIFAAQTALLAC
jgi:hypothetical protein